MVSIERIVGSGETSASVYLSDGSVLHIPKTTVYEKGFRKGDSLDETVLSELQIASELSKIKDSALRFLSMRQHSSFELSQKLLKKGFSKQLITQVIQLLTGQNIIDDLKYAESYAAEALHFKKDGVQKVKSNLIKRGIRKEIIDDVLSAYEGEEEYFTSALELARKKLPALQRTKSNTSQIKESLFRYLMGKGYKTATIQAVLQELPFNKDDEETGFPDFSD